MHRPFTPFRLLAACALLPLIAVPVWADDPPKAEPKAGDAFLCRSDGAVVLYVPAGEFLMGSPDTVGEPNEHPQRKVYLDAYYIDRTEVTNAQYGKFLAWMKKTNDHAKCSKDEPKGKDHTPEYWTVAHYNAPNQPVVGVDWYDAFAYAAWAGKTLPTEAQWEKAARGTDGRLYPWGNDWDENKCITNNHAGANAAATVGSVPDDRSPYGCLDMAGNVREWCGDWLGDYDPAATRNPTGPATGTDRAIRGGSCGTNGADSFRIALRSEFSRPDNRDNYSGFRCAIQVTVGAR